jgi:uncharacterized radical SAM superfamily protein
MITKLAEGKAELIELLTKFSEKYEVDHTELVQVVGYALDEIKYPAVPTGVLTPKGEAEAKAEQDKKAKAPVKAPPAPSLNLATAK